MIENPDITVWLMFAPFWLLGLAALAGAAWHAIHFVIVHARAQEAGHVPRTSLLRRLHWHELSDDGRHHLRRALIALGTFIGLCIGGVVVGIVATFMARV